MKLKQRFRFVSRGLAFPQRWLRTRTQIVTSTPAEQPRSRTTPGRALLDRELPRYRLVRTTAYRWSPRSTSRERVEPLARMTGSMGDAGSSHTRYRPPGVCSDATHPRAHQNRSVRSGTPVHRAASGTESQSPPVAIIVAPLARASARGRA